MEHLMNNHSILSPILLFFLPVGLHLKSNIVSEPC
eukprot:Gb_37491 [translate_table: standard]